MEERQKIWSAAAGPLLAWYDLHQRALPWRGTQDPYRVWVSEIMLQQTRVAAVIPYYQRWIKELPTVAALAAVPEERLMKLWQGLGYYSRARNLQRAAQIILSEHEGRFPEALPQLLKLPGIGDYTAGAIASIAFGQPVPAVDGNVLRVAARVLDIREDIMSPRVRKEIRQLTAAAIPPDRPGAFNQALMDLGATACLPNGPPACGSCPLGELCQANRLGTQAALPIRAPKAGRRVEELTVCLLLREGRVALRQRPSHGLLAGLWEFPHVPGTLDERRAGKAVADWGLTPLDWRKRLEARHIFTHVEWHMTGYLLTVKGDGPEVVWVDREGLEALAVPSAFGKFLAEAHRALAEPGGPAGAHPASKPIK